MGFLVNDLSFHGQFSDLVSFKLAIGRLMMIRDTVRRFGRELHCHRGMAQADVMQNMTLPQAIGNLTRDEQRSLLSWITQNGPFWDETRYHSPEDWLEYNGNIVTDTAVGEAAWCQLWGIERELVSLIPSNWQFSPIPVDWLSGTDVKKTIHVVNHFDNSALASILKLAPVPLLSWPQLESMTAIRCSNLTFAADAFAPLNGSPFSPGSAKRLLFILEKLDRFKVCFDGNGQRTSEGNEIYQDFFTGVKESGGRGAIFTDSSDGEKDSFKKEMTFKNPDDANKTLFCTWHGKAQTPQLRVHFSYPVRANEPLYIVYVGPKITKR